MQDSITPELIDELVPALKAYADCACTEGFAINAACLMLETIADKLRTGQLILAQPSGDEVEAVACKLETAFVVQMEAQADDTTPSSIHREQGRVWLEGWFDLTTALSNALDAHRGKQ